MNSSSEYYHGKRAEITILLPAHYSRVLEIGCGEGGFRSNLDQEHEYWGVEPVEYIAKLAQNRLNKVLVGTYQEVENLIPNDHFDLIICNDVIEHMPDHDAFFQSIKEKLKKDGSLVASIPNVRYGENLWNLLIKKDWEYKNEGILDKTHLRFFTQKSLTRTLISNGFLIEQIIGINGYQPRSPLKRLVHFFTTLLLGRDTKYLQFGIRIKDAQNPGRPVQRTLD